MPESETTTPSAEDVLAQLMELAERDAKGFLGEVAGKDDLITHVVRLAGENPLWLEAVVAKLRASGMLARDCDRFAVIIRERVKSEQRARRRGRPPLREVDPNEGPPLVREAIPTAPVSDEAVVPAGYVLSHSGVSLQRETEEGDVKTVEIAPAPVVITGRLINTADGSEYSRIAWTRDHSWKTTTVERVNIMDRAQVIRLANQGLPVYSGSAAALAQYFSTYEATNAAVIPRGSISTHMGWQGEHGDRGFLVGRRLLTTTGTDAGELDASDLSASGWAEDHLAFYGADAGDNQFASGLTPAGSIAEWAQAIAPVAPYPQGRIAIYASLAAVLLQIIGCDSFVIDWSGVTSQGKTTMLRLAGSVWGNPDPTIQGSVVGTWNASRVYIERKAALYNGLPVPIDDSKQAKDQRFIGQTIYDLTSGQGRGRGSPAGMRRSGTWRTVILSTGESPLIEATQDGGTRARVITFWGSPFGETTLQTGIVVNRVTNAVAQYYGHAGPAFVQYLLANRDAWERWRTVWREEIQRYHELDPDNPVAGRLGRYLAAIHVAAILAHECLPMPWEFSDPIEPIWETVTTQAAEADRAKAALGLVLSWAAANQHTFDGRLDLDKDFNEKTPLHGLSGRWDRDTNWTTIAFFPHRLKEILEKAGFDAEAVIRTWKDREWIAIDGDRNRNTKRVRISGERVWAIVIKRPEDGYVDDDQQNAAA